MSLLTTWGYTITESDALPEMLTAEEFAIMTAGKYAGDVRIPDAIGAACMGVRNFCGWHVYPAMACSYSERMLSGNGRIKRTGPDILIQLPAACVTVIESVTVGGEAWEDFTFEPNGLLRLFDVNPMRVSRKTAICINYTAGIPDGMMASIREVIAGRATRALVATNGIASESAGGVSISYSASWANGGGAGALQSTDAETLEPYRLREVF